MRKCLVSRFRTHYYTRANNPEKLAKDLMQVITQCEATERSPLVSPEKESVKKLVETKSKFDHSLERLLHELSELNLNMVSGAVNNPTRIEKRKIGEYFAGLQMELSRNIKELLDFQTQVNGRCNTILKLNEFTMFREDPQMNVPDEGNNRFIPDKKFLLRLLARYHFTTGTDNISDQVVK